MSNQYDIEEISEYLIENIEDLLSYLDIEDYQKHGDRISLKCPVHGGDNPEGFSIYVKGIGNWQCFTNQCHVEFGTSRGASIISLIQAIKKISFYEALKEAAKIAKATFKHIDDTTENKSNFTKLAKILNRQILDNKIIANKKTIKSSLNIPAQYFINRGYSKDILIKYDVGLCIPKNKPMSNRIVVPLYDYNGYDIIGCTGRSIYEKCELCKFFHNKDDICPITLEDKLNASKWRNNAGFKAANYVYNLWNIDYKYSNTLILVEGAADVWKLEEFGIKNSLALLGVKFTNEQLAIINELGFTNIIIATDNDDAGKKSREYIRQECSRLYNIYDFYPIAKDIGEAKSLDEIKSILNLIK